VSWKNTPDPPAAIVGGVPNLLAATVAVLPATSLLIANAICFASKRFCVESNGTVVIWFVAKPLTVTAGIR
jgi:hypothetical protein